MAPSPKRLEELQGRIKEYEQVIASFEITNGNLRLRRTNASLEIKAFCERHIEQNSRTIVSLRQNLDVIKQQLATESSSPW